MAVIRPFQGIVYDTSVAGPIEALVAPPYDVISATQQEALYEQSPNNVIRLELNRDDDRYASAADIYRDWLARGVLTRDAEPALYAYAQRYALEDGRELERWGVFARLRLESFESGIVRPHERTHGAAKKDRLALLEACQANLSPIFGLFSAPEWTLEQALGGAVAGEALHELRDAAGTTHRFWRVTDPAVIEAVTSRLADRSVYIADGHHRYETALAYRDERRKTLGTDAEGPHDYVLAFLANMEEPGLMVRPTHRVVRELRMPAREVLEDLRRVFATESVPRSEGLEALRKALAARKPGERRFAFVHRDLDDACVFTARDGSLDDQLDGSLALRRLDVSILHGIVLEGMLLVHAHEIADAGGLVYVKDDREALERVDSGGFACAFLMNATGLDEVREVCDAGDVMPEKSTYFYPKLLTGLVFHSVAE